MTTIGTLVEKQSAPSVSVGMTAEASSTSLDKIDCRILEELKRNGRLPNSELAKRVGISKAQCWRRTRRLEENKRILGYHARIAPDASPSIMAFVTVQLEPARTPVLKNFATAVQAMPEVVECFVVAGDQDYLLKVASPSTELLENVLVARIAKISGVRRVSTRLVVSAVKTAS